ncbi:MAG: hypothetical protein IT366_20880 [Candidatus Hydrogenedentes bacterium]|nr:hypothetical protein [Candidatus Hydrogenedentota bacterium]
MNEGIDETTEYLLEEYALERLSDDGRARVEALLRANPALRARVEELRREARLLSSALANSARDDADAVPNTNLAMLLDGALDELDRATLEASLAGDLHAQAILTALYRETRAIVNEESLPAREPAGVSVADVVVPLPPVARARAVSLNDSALAAAGLLFISSFFAPHLTATPILFLALGAFAWWAAQTVPNRTQHISARRRSAFGVLPSLIMFVTGFFAGAYSIWCYVFSAGWYWYWLVQRWNPARADLEARVTRNDERQEVRRGSGKG